MAAKKSVGNVAAKNGQAEPTAAAKKTVRQPAPAKPQEPSARNCPLVLDGEMDAAAFTPNACLSCDEFDCRFCEAAAGSGALRSRLFAGDGEGDDEDDGWGGDTDFVSGDDTPDGDDDEALF
jgi:hypothetical protein